MNEEMNGQNYESQDHNSQPSAGEPSSYSYGANTSNQSDYNGQPNYNGQSNYTGQPNYNVNGAPQQEKPEGGIGFGIASLVLGIISLVTFCMCVNIPCAILAIIFGIIQLVRGNGKGLAIGGLITSGFSLVAMVVFWVVVGFSMPQKSDLNDWNSFMKKYEKNMDNYDYKYDESDDNSTF